MKEAIIRTMRNVYFICKENLTKEKLSLQELLLQQDYKQIEMLKFEENIHYTHHECVDFIQAIQTVNKDKVLGKNKSSKFYGPEIDESTDYNTSQNLMRYIRAVVEVKVVSNFLSIEQSNVLFTSVRSIKSIGNIESLNIKGLQTSGLLSVVGCKSGLVSLFKKENPFIISEHCATQTCSSVWSSSKQCFLFSQISKK